jgi:cytochrome c553
MLRRRRSLTAAVGIARLCLLAGLLTACGAGGGEEAVGKQVFIDAGCGDCHSLAATGSTGTIGPDLDQVRPDVARVVQQVMQGGGAMPSFGDRLSESEIQDVARFVSASTRPAKERGSVAAQFRPDGTVLADCDSEFRCYEQAFANVAYREGPKRALALLDTRSAKPGPIESNCHRITHAIGAGALAHFDGDPGKALAAGSVLCASGYYHGILERSLLGKPEEAIAPIAQRICSDPDIRRTDFIHFQCVHGLGHGLMIYTGYDLPRSLDHCEPLETEWERESCRGGVFMENSQSSYGVRSRWLKDDDLLYPCDWVAEKHKYQCYLIQLARIGPALGFNWAKVSDTCREADEGYVEVCFQSMGREISGQVRHDAARILAACRVTGDMERECIYGAARDVTYNDAGSKRSKELCDNAPRTIRGYCWNGIGTILGSINPTAKQKQAACAEATTQYYAACARGANV